MAFTRVDTTQPAVDAWQRIAPRVWFSPDTNGCWEWTGATTNGYGVIGIEGRTLRVHRVVYESQVGPIPEGLELDHLCRNRRCCNPAHLEPVNHAVNAQRSPLMGKWQREPGWLCRAKEHHDGYVNKQGKWICRICRNERKTAYRRGKPSAFRDCRYN